MKITLARGHCFFTEQVSNFRSPKWFSPGFTSAHLHRHYSQAPAVQRYRRPQRVQLGPAAHQQDDHLLTQAPAHLWLLALQSHLCQWCRLAQSQLDPSDPSAFSGSRSIQCLLPPVAVGSRLQLWRRLWHWPGRIGYFRTLLFIKRRVQGTALFVHWHFRRRWLVVGWKVQARKENESLCAVAAREESSIITLDFCQGEAKARLYLLNAHEYFGIVVSKANDRLTYYVRRA